MSTEAPQSTIYQLKVIRAEDLCIGHGSKEDPNAFVKVSCQEFKARTKAIRSSSTPSWEDTISFPLDNQNSDIDTTITFKMMHKTRFFGRSRLLGKLDIPVSEVLKQSLGHQEVALELIPANDKGELRPRIKVHLSTIDARSGLELTTMSAEHATGRIQHSLASKATGPVDTLTSGVSSQVDTVAALGMLLEKIDLFMRIVDKAAAITPYANLAWKLTSSVYQAIRAQVNRDQKVLDLTTSMVSVYTFVDAIQDVPQKIDVLSNTIDSIFKQTIECILFLREYTGKGFGGRLLSNLIVDNAQAKVDEFIKNFTELRANFETGVNVQVVMVTFRIQHGVTFLLTNQDLRRLVPESSSLDYSSLHSCLPNTRDDALGFISDWVTGEPTDTNVLLLTGPRGSGKSTIATTMAHRFQDLRRLGAWMFFNSGKTGRGWPSRVIRTVAYELGMFENRIGAMISEVVQRDPKISKRPLEEQFAKLLVEPLTSSKEAFLSKGPVLIVLDALDECGDAMEREGLLTALATQACDLPRNFRILITTSHENDVCMAFEGHPHVVYSLNSVTTAPHSDISTFLKTRMAAIRDKKSKIVGLELEASWPGEAVIYELTNRTQGNFKCAAIVADFIDGHSPPKRLMRLLNGDLALDKREELAQLSWVERGRSVEYCDEEPFSP